MFCNQYSIIYTKFLYSKPKSENSKRCNFVLGKSVIDINKEWYNPDPSKVKVQK